MGDNDSEKKRTIYFIAEKDTFIEALQYHLSPLGIEVKYCNDPGSVINNIQKEIPDMILFNAVDFPRRWKPLLKLIRDEKSHKQTIFFLIADTLPFEEAAKAAYLNINGIIPKNLIDRSSITKLHQLLNRYERINDKRKDIRIIPKPYDRIALLFFHPRKSCMSIPLLINRMNLLLLVLV